MVVHAEHDQNQHTDAPEGPTLRVKASGLRSLGEQRQHVLPLLSRQPGWTATARAVFQTTQVALVPIQLLGPFMDGHPADPHVASDGCLG